MAGILRGVAARNNQNTKKRFYCNKMRGIGEKWLLQKNVWIILSRRRASPLEGMEKIIGNDLSRKPRSGEFHGWNEHSPNKKSKWGFVLSD
ncbi:MAG: hypothetical protein BWK73_34520 [Thiothrix lacustris]|uniref:Uncharacterized protein n=1 Tax=Thiothrix lacustris TaxID=525917 RepID=A0A1Y1QGG0_9GAMM|nr:MAG: hypothetical protein BWK73_34520 [Thiothrix lacustris]